MTFRANGMGLGTPAGQAGALIGGVATTLTATGSAQTDAYALDLITNNVFTTTASGTGARLNANVSPGDNYRVFNLGANALLVYPPTGAAINSSAANAGVSVAAGKGAIFVNISPTQWSAVIGA